MCNHAVGLTMICCQFRAELGDLVAQEIILFSVEGCGVGFYMIHYQCGCTATPFSVNKTCFASSGYILLSHELVFCVSVVQVMVLLAQEDNWFRNNTGMGSQTSKDREIIIEIQK